MNSFKVDFLRRLHSIKYFMETHNLNPAQISCILFVIVKSCRKHLSYARCVWIVQFLSILCIMSVLCLPIRGVFCVQVGYILCILCIHYIYILCAYTPNYVHSVNIYAICSLQCAFWVFWLFSVYVQHSHQADPKCDMSRCIATDYHHCFPHHPHYCRILLWEVKINTFLIKSHRVKNWQNIPNTSIGIQ